MIDAVDQRQQLAFRHHGRLDVMAQDADDLVVGVQVGRVGKADAQTTLDLVQHDGPKTPRLSFRQAVDQFLARIERLQIDEDSLQLTRQRACNRLFRNVALFDDNAPEFAAAAFLLIE